MRTLLVPFSLKAAAKDAAPGAFQGYGSIFGNVDLGKDVCEAGCFGRSLAEHKSRGTLPAMYWMHDRSEPCGDWLSMTEDDKGLAVDGLLWTGDKAIEASRKAYNLLRGTSPKGLSIGYMARKWRYDNKTGVRTLEDVDLLEVSVVGYGMNPEALVTHVKSIIQDGNIPAVRDLEDLLRDAGLSATQAKALLAHGYRALRDAEGDAKAADLDALRSLRAALRGDTSRAR